MKESLTRNHPMPSRLRREASDLRKLADQTVYCRRMADGRLFVQFTLLGIVLADTAEHSESAAYKLENLFS
jgi:hypothetical protein